LLVNETYENQIILSFLSLHTCNDNQLHKDIDPVATPEEVRVMAEKLRLQFPFSYEYFLEKFGNGAYWLYHLDQPINGVDEKYGIHRLGKYRKRLGDTVESDGFGTFKTNSLLCLMTENSNGGAWVWLTSEKSRLGEWPLAYLDEGKLYYKVPNFIEWLKIATHCKGEVIRELDVEYRLGLG